MLTPSTKCARIEHYIPSHFCKLQEASGRKDQLVKVHNVVPMWKSKEELLQQVTSTLAKVWRKMPLPLEEVGGTYDGLETPALVTMPLTWQPSQQGICLLDFFGGIDSNLAAILQVGIKV